MKKHSPKSPDIARLDRNFWKQLTEHDPDYDLESHNAFLLFLDDDRHLLDYVHLMEGETSCTDVMAAFIALKRSVKISALVRIQIQSAYKPDPLRRNSLQTDALYAIAKHYKLHLADVILPRFT